MESKALTELEKRVLKAVGDLKDQNGIAPTLKELGVSLGYGKNFQFLSKYIKSLSDKGYLERGTGWRKWSVVQDTVAIPFLGTINAGPLALEEQQDLKYDLPLNLLRQNPEGCFLLRVSGNSMSPKFEDGDLVLIDPKRQPKDGDVIAATVDGQSTLKTLRFSGNGKVILWPENKNYIPIVFESQEDFDSARLDSQGVVVQQIKLRFENKDLKGEGD